MSKSLGNVIAPHEVVEKYGTDATRYMLLRHVHPVDDSDVTWEKFDEWYTAHLVNGLGNLVARVMKLAEDHLEPIELTEEILKIEPEFLKLITDFRFNEAIEIIFKRIGESDESMSRTEPYKMIKVVNSYEEAKENIRSLVRQLAIVATQLQIIMPETSEKILTAIKESKKPENLFPRLS